MVRRLVPFEYLEQLDDRTILGTITEIRIIRGNPASLVILNLEDTAEVTTDLDRANEIWLWYLLAQPVTAKMLKDNGMLLRSADRAKLRSGRPLGRAEPRPT